MHVNFLEELLKVANDALRGVYNQNTAMPDPEARFHEANRVRVPRGWGFYIRDGIASNLYRLALGKTAADALAEDANTFTEDVFRRSVGDTGPLLGHLMMDTHEENPEEEPGRVDQVIRLLATSAPGDRRPIPGTTILKVHVTTEIAE